MAVTISGSVGFAGKNNAADIPKIQTLLNKWLEPKIAVSGACTGKADDPTVIAIKAFQSRFSKNPDGRVDAGGGTLKKLNSEPLSLLPQVSNFGYYSYGKGNWNERQWGTAATIGALLEISMQFKWNNPNTLVAIGDISFQFGGEMKPHSTHQEGKHVDLRPCRKDNTLVGVKYQDTLNYDQEKTKQLIELFLSHKNVKSILFNDPVIHAMKSVSPWDGHDDHFHVTMYE
jgi:hypothetical protein